MAAVAHGLAAAGASGGMRPGGHRLPTLAIVVAVILAAAAKQSDPGLTASTITLVISLVGLVLAVASLTWQAVTFALSGGRGKVTLKVGAVSGDCMGLALGPVSGAAESLGTLAAQGFGDPVVAIEVRNVGRLPITIRGWSARVEGGWAWSLPGDSLNPATPYRLDTGEFATWCARVADLSAFVYALDKGPQDIRMEVQLGNGKVLRTTESVPLRASGPSIGTT